MEFPPLEVIFDPDEIVQKISIKKTRKVESRFDANAFQVDSMCKELNGCLIVETGVSPRAVIGLIKRRIVAAVIVFRALGNPVEGALLPGPEIFQSFEDGCIGINRRCVGSPLDGITLMGDSPISLKNQFGEEDDDQQVFHDRGMAEAKYQTVSEEARPDGDPYGGFREWKAGFRSPCVNTAPDCHDRKRQDEKYRVSDPGKRMGEEVFKGMTPGNNESSSRECANPAKIG